MNELGLYFHIPFCKRKCPYCGFFSQSGKDKLWDKYFKTLETEFNFFIPEVKKYKISTIYIGGGTPSLVPSHFIASILKTVKGKLKIDNKVEISIEANPESLNQEKLLDYRNAEINRLSLGLQAWQDDLLKKLNRYYTNAYFQNIFYKARETGFKNINIDLMFGLPGQTLEMWQESLIEVIKLKPEHIACYSLELDRDTTWFRLNDIGQLNLPKSSENRQMYRLTKRLLKQAGYLHYEISNWAIPGKECRHNLDFWNYKPYIGIGAGAHSFLGNYRWSNKEDIDHYITTIKRHSSNIKKYISNKYQNQERIMLGLRLRKGIDCVQIGDDFLQSKETIIKNLKKEGLIYKNPKCLRLTQHGLDLENYVIKQLIN